MPTLAVITPARDPVGFHMGSRFASCLFCLTVFNDKYFQSFSVENAFTVRERGLKSSQVLRWSLVSDMFFTTQSHCSL